MKRLLLAVSLFGLSGTAYAGQGSASTLVVSSGSFKAVQGFNNNANNFVQAITVTDSSYTVTAPVDALIGLTVNLASSTAEVGNIKNAGVFAVQAAQSGVFQVETGTNTYPVAIKSGTVAATQSGVFQVEPGTNTYPVAIKAGTVAATQSGAWSVTQAVDATLNASVSIKGTSNTVTANDVVLVSSNTAVPTGVADAGSARAMGDSYGRQVTMPIAPRAMIQVATATLTTSTAETVFISSPSAKFVRLVGCIGENSSATAADLTIRLNGQANNVGSFKLGVSANSVPVGFFPPGGIVSQTQNVNTTIQGSASVSSIFLTCWYILE